MTKKLLCLSIMLFVAGCGMTGETELQTQEVQAPAIVVTEKQTDIAETARPVEFRQNQEQPEPTTNEVFESGNRTLSKDEIRLFQVRLKTVGFDPGPPDGLMGPKTEKALLRFQSACAALSDVLGGAEMETVWNVAGMQATKPSTPVNQTSNKKDEIRTLQTRMKAAGLDPGPIDGVMGIKTKSLLLATQSGCSKLKMFPVISDQDFQTPEKRRPVLGSPKKPSQPAASSSAPATPVNKQPSSPSISRKAWLAPMTSN
jgi:hypothetical protein